MLPSSPCSLSETAVFNQSSPSLACGFALFYWGGLAFWQNIHIPQVFLPSWKPPHIFVQISWAFLLYVHLLLGLCGVRWRTAAAKVNMALLPHLPQFPPGLPTCVHLFLGPAVFSPTFRARAHTHTHTHSGSRAHLGPSAAFWCLLGWGRPGAARD